MAKLKPGAITIDLETGGIYGDLDHCPQEDLLESAEALLSLLPKVQHKGLWGFSKAFDTDCYLHTSAKRYQRPNDLELEQDVYRGSGGMSPTARPFKLGVFPSASRETYWRFKGYEKLIGSVRDGQVSLDTKGIPDLTADARAEQERWQRRYQQDNPKQLKLELV